MEMNECIIINPLTRQEVKNNRANRESSDKAVRLKKKRAEIKNIFINICVVEISLPIIMAFFLMKSVTLERVLSLAGIIAMFLAFTILWALLLCLVAFLDVMPELPYTDVEKLCLILPEIQPGKFNVSDRSLFYTEKSEIKNISIHDAYIKYIPSKSSDNVTIDCLNNIICIPVSV